VLTSSETDFLVVLPANGTSAIIHTIVVVFFFFLFLFLLLRENNTTAAAAASSSTTTTRSASTETLTAAATNTSAAAIHNLLKNTDTHKTRQKDKDGENYSREWIATRNSAVVEIATETFVEQGRLEFNELDRKFDQSLSSQLETHTHPQSVRPREKRREKETKDGPDHERDDVICVSENCPLDRRQRDDC
jgi:hypothetical protein